MRLPMFVVLGIALAGSVRASTSPAVARGARLAVELGAIRSVLVSYRPAVLTLDPQYARPGQAPPGMTGRLRPAARQRALSDSLRRDVVAGGGDTLRVRASEPVLEGSTATISVTVDGRLAGGHHGAFYETVVFEFAHDGTAWIIRRRTQLGIS